jgi:AAA15 family ATPase/GTPase
MILEINNIGKIRKAEIKMRGITVIAGNNNTGKSTYGKILYCMFNAFCNAEASIQKEREHNIENIMFRYFGSVRLGKTLVNNIIKHQSSKEEIRKLLNEVINNNNKIVIRDKIKDTVIDSVFERVMRSGEVTNKQVQKMILTRFLRLEFGNQITHVNHSEEKGTISLKIKGNILSASVKNDACIDFTDHVGIIYNALYIDTPFIIDEIDHSYPIIETGHRGRLIKSLSKPFDDINAIDEILAKQQSQRILSCIRNVVTGEFNKSEEGWMFQEEGLNDPLGMHNISTGMKPFLIIKRLIEAGEIKEQGVLVFDEPEIHLHPEWQIKYAELLVLLQKEFNVNILLATHSPYFLNAIEVYSQKNGISDHCNYYLTDTQGDACVVNEVTENIDLVYQKLAKPFQYLENLRYMEN